MKITLDLEIDDLMEYDPDSGESFFSEDKLLKEIISSLTDKYFRHDSATVTREMAKHESSIKYAREQKIKEEVDTKLESFFDKYFQEEVYIQGASFREGKKMSVAQYLDDNIQRMMSIGSCGEAIPRPIADYINKMVKKSMDSIQYNTDKAIKREIERQVSESNANKVLQKLLAQQTREN